MGASPSAERIHRPDTSPLLPPGRHPHGPGYRSSTYQSRSYTPAKQNIETRSRDIHGYGSNKRPVLSTVGTRYHQNYSYGAGTLDGNRTTLEKSCLGQGLRNRNGNIPECYNIGYNSQQNNISEQSDIENASRSTQSPWIQNSSDDFYELGKKSTLQCVSPVSRRKLPKSVAKGGGFTSLHHSAFIQNAGELVTSSPQGVRRRDAFLLHTPKYLPPKGGTAKSHPEVMRISANRGLLTDKELPRNLGYSDKFQHPLLEKLLSTNVEVSQNTWFENNITHRRLENSGKAPRSNDRDETYKETSKPNTSTIRRDKRLYFSDKNLSDIEEDNSIEDTRPNVAPSTRNKVLLRPLQESVRVVTKHNNNACNNLLETTDRSNFINSSKLSQERPDSGCMCDPIRRSNSAPPETGLQVRLFQNLQLKNLDRPSNVKPYYNKYPKCLHKNPYDHHDRLAVPYHEIHLLDPPQQYVNVLYPDRKEIPYPSSNPTTRLPDKGMMIKEGNTEINILASQNRSSLAADIVTIDHEVTDTTERIDSKNHINHKELKVSVKASSNHSISLDRKPMLKSRSDRSNLRRNFSKHLNFHKEYSVDEDDSKYEKSVRTSFNSELPEPEETSLDGNNNVSYNLNSREVTNIRMISLDPVSVDENVKCRKESTGGSSYATRSNSREEFSQGTPHTTFYNRSRERNVDNQGHFPHPLLRECPQTDLAEPSVDQTRDASTQPWEVDVKQRIKTINTRNVQPKADKNSQEKPSNIRSKLCSEINLKYRNQRNLFLASQEKVDSDKNGWLNQAEVSCDAPPRVYFPKETRYSLPILRKERSPSRNRESAANSGSQNCHCHCRGPLSSRTLSRCPHQCLTENKHTVPQGSVNDRVGLTSCKRYPRSATTRSTYWGCPGIVASPGEPSCNETWSSKFELVRKDLLMSPRFQGRVYSGQMEKELMAAPWMDHGDPEDLYVKGRHQHQHKGQTMNGVNGINGHGDLNGGSGGDIISTNNLRGCWTIGLINSKFRYLTAETFGFKINANGASLKKKQVWTLEPASGGAESTIFLRSHLDKYLAVDSFGNVTCEGEEKEPGSKFQISVADDGTGRWAFRNVVRGYYLGASSDKLTCTAKVPGDAEFWHVHLAARPQVNLRSVGRKRFAHLSENLDEIHVDANIPWGEDTLFTLEFRPDESGKYALHTCNNKYLSREGKLVDTCNPNCLFSAEYHGGQLALRDRQGAYLSPIGSKAVLKSRSTSVTKDELFSLEDSLPQASFVAALNARYVSVKQGVDVTANQDEISDHETFQLEFDSSTKRWYIRTMQDRYWTLETGGGIQACGDKKSSNALFDLAWQGDGSVGFRANNGKYVATKRSGHLYANADTVDDNAKYYFYLINRPILVLKSEQGFVGYKSATSPKLECNKATYETIQVERSEKGVVFFKGQNGKYWHVDGEAVTADTDTPEGFFLELREPTRICIKSVTGEYLVASKNGAFRLGDSDYENATKWEY